MFINVKASTDRLVDNYVDMDESFKDSVADFKRYMFKFALEVRETDELCNDKGLVAIVKGTMFCETALLNDDEDIMYWADSESLELFEAMEILCGSLPKEQRPASLDSVLDEGYDEDKLFENRVTGLISIFYVSPKYRRQGVATYILNNFYDIIMHKFFVATHHIVINAAPYEVARQDGDEHIFMYVEDDVRTATKHNTELLVSAGYKPLESGTNFFGRNYCLADKDLV